MFSEPPSSKSGNSIFPKESFSTMSWGKYPGCVHTERVGRFGNRPQGSSILGQHGETRLRVTAKSTGLLWAPGQLSQSWANPSKHTSPPPHLGALPVKSREGSGKESSVEHKVPPSPEMSTPRACLSPRGSGVRGRLCLMPPSRVLLTGHHCTAFWTQSITRDRHYC